MNLWLICSLLLAHTVGDFLLQTRWMGENKSHNWSAMCLHIIVYSLILLPFGFMFALFNGLAHMATDIVTSNISSHCYKTKQMDGFWLTIGTDQMIHMMTLLCSWHLFG